MSVLKRFRSAAWIAIVIAALPCFAGEVAILKNGFSIRHERHEVVGDVTRLYTSVDGSSFVDVPTAQVDHFEAVPDLPSPVASPASSRLAVSGPTASYATVRASGSRMFPAAPAPNITEVVKDASGRYRLDPDLVNSVIKAESAFNARAVSPKGAQGLMQLMPGTASQLGVPNAFDAQANVEGGTRYLRELLERYNFDLVKALAAYNAGPQRVEKFGGVPPYYETRAYVARIVKDFNKKKIAQGKSAGTRNNVVQQKGAQAKQTAVAKISKSAPRTTVAAAKSE